MSLRCSLSIEFPKSSVALIICRLLNLLFLRDIPKVFHYCGDLFSFLCNNFKLCFIQVYFEGRVLN